MIYEERDSCVNSNWIKSTNCYGQSLVKGIFCRLLRCLKRYRLLCSQVTNRRQGCSEAGALKLQPSVNELLLFAVKFLRRGSPKIWNDSTWKRSRIWRGFKTSRSLRPPTRGGSNRMANLNSSWRHINVPLGSSSWVTITAHSPRGRSPRCNRWCPALLVPCSSPRLWPLSTWWKLDYRHKIGCMQKSELAHSAVDCHTY